MQERLSRSIAYFSRRTAIPRFYPVHLNAKGEDSDWPDARARILPFLKLAQILKL